MSVEQTEVRLFCSSVSELNAQALSQIVEIEEGVSISDYFAYAKKLIQNAGQSKQNREIERMYMFLVQFLMYVSML